MIMAVSLFLIVIIIKPRKPVVTYLYDTGKKTRIEKLPKNIVQYMNPGVDDINGLYVYLEDDSIINCDFHVDVTDDNNNKYFSQDIIDYESNILYLSFGNITNSKDKTFKLSINLLNCLETSGMVGKSINGKNYLGDDKNKTLKITIDSTSKNNSYYWYIFMLISLSLLLFPLARGEENENQK